MCMMGKCWKNNFVVKEINELIKCKCFLIWCLSFNNGVYVYMRILDIFDV